MIPNLKAPTEVNAYGKPHHYLKFLHKVEKEMKESTSRKLTDINLTTWYLKFFDFSKRNNNISNEKRKFWQDIPYTQHNII